MYKKITCLFVIFLSIGCTTIPKSVEEYRTTLKSKKVDGYNMTYIDKGPQDGDVIVLLHGIPTSSYLYRNIINPLAEKGFRVIAPDYIGFGGSDKPEDGDVYKIENQADRTIRFLHSLEIPKAHFVVHDMGGLIAWEMMTKNSDIFQSLLILNSTAYAQGFNPPSEMRMMGGVMGGVMASMMESRLVGPFLMEKFLSDYMVHSERLSKEDIEQFWWPAHEGTTYPMRYIAKNFDNIISQFPVYQEQLKKFDKPTFVLWGEKDRVLNFEQISAQLQRDLRIPQNQISSVQDAGHFIQEDASQIIVEKVFELTQAAHK